MDSLHALPPHKRFTLKNHHHHHQKDDKATTSPPRLPAKKRKESRSADSFCLPAKKRVWAIRPFDLNLEYNPSNDEEEESKNTQKANREEHDVKHNPSTDSKANNIKEEESKNTQKRNCEKNDKEEDISMAKEESKITQKPNFEEIKDNDNDVDDGIKCAICESTDGEPLDPIVFCDGCDLMVHATCYGNPLIKGVPEGDWFCSQCLNSNSSEEEKLYSCCLCPVLGGALKPTNDGRWAHVVCAIMVPEVFFCDAEGREGIDCSMVPTRRWEEKCYVCGAVNGCVIDCSEAKCDLGFHVTCGLKEELCIEYREGKSKGAIVAGFCKSHTQLWKKQQDTGKFRIVARAEHIN